MTMKKLVLMGFALLIPTAAHAGFSMKDTSGQVMTMAPAAPAPTKSAPQSYPAHQPAVTAPTTTAVKKRPALEIINERYVPDDIKKKYAMGDDYFEMTKPPVAPVVLEAAPAPAQKLPLPAPTPLAAAPVAPAPVPMPPPAAAPSPVYIATPVQPPVPAHIAVPSAVAPMPLEVASMPATPAPVIVNPAPKAMIVEDAVKKAPPIPVPAERVDTWRARRGEDMRSILKRWSDRAGTEFVWTAAESPKISDEFSYMGTFQDATTKLISQNGGQLKMKFADEVPPAVNDDAPRPMAEVPLVAAADPVALAGVADDMRIPKEEVEKSNAKDRSWFATTGSSLKEVLHAWAETEGANLVWQSDQNFAVKKSISKKGGFEDALADILTQYDGQKLRPVGQLYKNPISGEKVLVIRTDRS